MILGLEGQTSVGKSTLMYSSPLPSVHFSFDSGATRSIYGGMNELFKGIDVEIVQYPPPPISDIKEQVAFWTRNEGKCITIYLLPQPMQMGPTMVGVTELWNRFTLLSNLAIQQKEIATVGFDTATIMRRIAADSHLQDLQKKDASRKNLLQVEWGVPGNMVRTVFTTCQNQSEYCEAAGLHKNFIFTHHLTEQRVGEKIVTDSQGNPLWMMEGLHNTLRFLDIMLRMEKLLLPVPDPFGGKTTKVTGIEAEFIKCGYDISLEGTKIQNPTWDKLASALNKNLHPKAQIMLRDVDE